ncbi:MAG: hypothetical protein P0S95_06450 [Rhabdochlamydiaceae bacterium]|nr:hypothetical protein [Candidatus Amphrikana amoebophyrae]
MASKLGGSEFAPDFKVDGTGQSYFIDPDSGKKVLVDGRVSVTAHASLDRHRGSFENTQRSPKTGASLDVSGGSPKRKVREFVPARLESRDDLLKKLPEEVRVLLTIGRISFVEAITRWWEDEMEKAKRHMKTLVKSSNRDMRKRNEEKVLSDMKRMNSIKLGVFGVIDKEQTYGCGKCQVPKTWVYNGASSIVGYGGPVASALTSIQGAFGEATSGAARATFWLGVGTFVGKGVIDYALAYIFSDKEERENLANFTTAFALIKNLKESLETVRYILRACEFLQDSEVDFLVDGNMVSPEVFRTAVLGKFASIDPEFIEASTILRNKFDELFVSRLLRRQERLRNIDGRSDINPELLRIQKAQTRKLISSLGREDATSHPMHLTVDFAERDAKDSTAYRSSEDASAFVGSGAGAMATASRPPLAGGFQSVVAKVQVSRFRARDRDIVKSSVNRYLDPVEAALSTSHSQGSDVDEGVRGFSCETDYGAANYGSPSSLDRKGTVRGLLGELKALANVSAATPRIGVGGSSSDDEAVEVVTGAPYLTPRRSVLDRATTPPPAALPSDALRVATVPPAPAPAPAPSDALRVATLPPAPPPAPTPAPAPSGAIQVSVLTPRPRPPTPPEPLHVDTRKHNAASLDEWV